MKLNLCVANAVRGVGGSQGVAPTDSPVGGERPFTVTVHQMHQRWRPPRSFLLRVVTYCIY